MNVISAWKKGYTGNNIVVTILDDGIEHTHPDLQQNYVSIFSMKHDEIADYNRCTLFACSYCNKSNFY